MSSLYALGPTNAPVPSAGELREQPAEPPVANPPAVTNLPAVIRTVQPNQQRMLAVTDIAEHDSTVAETLRQRLDFSDVIEGGARLSVRDAYAVLSPNDFARFEAISQGFAKRDSESNDGAKVALGVLAVAAAGALALGVFTSLATSGQVAIDLIGGGLAIVLAGAVSSASDKAAAAAITNLGGTLAKLPPPDGGRPRAVTSGEGSENGNQNGNA